MMTEEGEGLLVLSRSFRKELEHICAPIPEAVFFCVANFQQAKTPKASMALGPVIVD